MQNDTIQGIIRREMNDFIYNYIEIVPNCLFNQYETIKRAHLYKNKQFSTNEKYQGREKMFFDVSSFRAENVAKAIDIDTKDTVLIPENPESENETFIAQKEFKQWMRDNHIGELYNEFSDDLSTYGSIVAKVVNSEIENVDLRRLFLDPTVKSIKDSRFIIHELYMTETELRKMKKKWNNVDKVIENFGSIYAPQSYNKDGMLNIIRSSPYYKIYERYGEVPEYMLDDSSNSSELVRAMFIVAEPQAIKVTESGVTCENGVILAKQKWFGDFPFEDCHLKKVKGRWLGLGTYEDLFIVQERSNELANQKRISMEISALHIFQTQDVAVPNNLTNYMENGSVLKTKTGITPIANEERNLGAFNSEEALYNQLADRITFSYDASRGEALPSSTPATNAVIQNNNINSYFSKKRENFGLFISRVMNNHVIPKIMKEISNEHIFKFMGSPEDLSKFDSIVSPYYVKKRVIKEILEGKEVYEDRLEEIKKEVSRDLKKQGNYRFTKLKEGFYKNTKFKYDVIITDEKKDMQVLAQNTFQVITQLAQNPALLEDPMLKTLYFKYCEMIGISPAELEIAMQKREEMKVNQPTSVAMPTDQPELTTEQLQIKEKINA